MTASRSRRCPFNNPAPNVRVIAAEDPDPVRVGWTATVGAVVEGVGMAGKASQIVLEQRGVEIAHEEHQWKENAERFDARLHYAPPSSGTSTVTLRVLPLEGEAVVTDNAVDLRLMVTERRLNVLAARAEALLERGVRASVAGAGPQLRSVDGRSGYVVVRGPRGPGRKAARRINGCRVEPLRRRAHRGARRAAAIELEALRTFARIRGGAIVFLPDRRPAGRYLDLIPSARFDEVLVDSPVAIQSIVGAPLRASEIAVYRASLAGVSVLASIELSIDRGKRPVVLEWPHWRRPHRLLGSDGRVALSRCARRRVRAVLAVPGSPRRQAQRRHASRRPSCQEFLVLVRT